MCNEGWGGGGTSSCYNLCQFVQIRWKILYEVRRQTILRFSSKLQMNIVIYLTMEFISVYRFLGIYLFSTQNISLYLSSLDGGGRPIFSCSDNFKQDVGTVRAPRSPCGKRRVFGITSALGENALHTQQSWLMSRKRSRKTFLSKKSISMPRVGPYMAARFLISTLLAQSTG